MSLNLKITGFQPLMERISALDKKVRNKTLRKVGNEGSKVLLKVAKQNVPVSKPEYGVGGSLKKAQGRKVQVKSGQMRVWFGAGARTKYQRTVTKRFRFWRDKKGRVRKAPLAWERKEQPSRRAHFSEKKTAFMSRSVQQATREVQTVMVDVMTEAVATA